jgi:ribosomal protein L2
VVPGVNVTEAPVAALKFVDGDHVYVAAPVAVKVTVDVAQIVSSATTTTGNGFTVTKT